MLFQVATALIGALPHEALGWTLLANALSHALTRGEEDCPQEALPSLFGLLRTAEARGFVNPVAVLQLLTCMAVTEASGAQRRVFVSRDILYTQSELLNSKAS